MANLKGSENPFPHVLIQEVATDGSDTGTPAADFRHLFLGEDGALHLKDSAAAVTAVGGGAVATDAIWDAAGDLVQGTGANTAAKLSLGASGTVVRSTGATNAYAYPPGYEVAYAEITSGVSVTATSEGAAHTVVATSSATYENVPYLIQCYSPRAETSTNGVFVFDIYVDSTILGRMGIIALPAGSAPYFGQIRYTPSAGSHTFTWKVWRGTNDGTLNAGAGGTGTQVAAYIRVVKA